MWNEIFCTRELNINHNVPFFPNNQNAVVQAHIQVYLYHRNNQTADVQTHIPVYLYQTAVVQAHKCLKQKMSCKLLCFQIWPLILMYTNVYLLFTLHTIFM